MFMLMLRCGLRVQEVAELTVDALEFQRRQIFVFHGKGAKDRIVYMSEDAQSALSRTWQNGPRKREDCFWCRKDDERETDIGARHPEAD